MIYIGGDHKGYKLKEKINTWLFDNNYTFEDLGALKFDPYDDYTQYASLVASLVSDNKQAKGILLCGSGVGVDIVANKFDGVRSSVGKQVEQVKAGRNDDDMNVLVIAADFTKEEEAVDMVKTFLETDFSKKDRYAKRLEEIEKLEENN
ncbi:MAG: RpiB/LacA/LacB family sugar-phosphate isomerase [Patescibacteria group bacterium]|mgnify:CR=1 FL=1